MHFDEIKETMRQKGVYAFISTGKEPNRVLTVSYRGLHENIKEEEFVKMPETTQIEYLQRLGVHIGAYIDLLHEKKNLDELIIKGSKIVLVNDEKEIVHVVQRAEREEYRFYCSEVFHPLQEVARVSKLKRINCEVCLTQSRKEH